MLHRTWASYYGGDIRAGAQSGSGAERSSADPRRAALARAVAEGERGARMLEARVTAAEAEALRAQLSQLERGLSPAWGGADASGGSSGRRQLQGYNCLCTPSDPRCQPTGSLPGSGPQPKSVLASTLNV